VWWIRWTILSWLIGDGGGNGGSIERRNVPIDGGGIAGGRAIETAAFGAAVMVVLGCLLNWIHHVEWAKSTWKWVVLLGLIQHQLQVQHPDTHTLPESKCPELLKTARRKLLLKCRWSNGYYGGRHGWMPFLLVDLVEKILARSQKVVQVKSHFC
jgi:hypothetical protein